MALSVKYHNPMLPEGELVDLGGFNVENGGEAVELTEEQEAGLMARTEMMPKDYFDASEDATVSGTPLLKQSDLDELVPPAEREDDTVVETAPVGAGTKNVNKDKEVNE